MKVVIITQIYLMTFAILCSQNRSGVAIPRKIHKFSISIPTYNLGTKIIQNTHKEQYPL